MINAKVARKNSEDNRQRRITDELSEIEYKIQNAVNIGLTTTYIDRIVFNENKEKLEELGYRVSISKIDNVATISW